ncbi:hypothetical protein LTR85_008990 [Meristemomyces frigidus]|nr:hypothetical protein LTR85_008990 [Meristemomyces frigidus]
MTTRAADGERKSEGEEKVAVNLNTLGKTSKRGKKVLRAVIDYFYAQGHMTPAHSEILFHLAMYKLAETFVMPPIHEYVADKLMSRSISVLRSTTFPPTPGSTMVSSASATSTITFITTSLRASSQSAQNWVRRGESVRR